MLPDPSVPDPVTSAEEIAHYDAVATSLSKREDLRSKVERVQRLGTSWGVPLVGWLDSVHDCLSQADVYAHVSACISGGRVVQIGGTGQAALKSLIGGAAKATLVTPSAGEAELAIQVAHDLGLGERFDARVGFAESLPLEDSSATAVISEACLHHTDVPVALAEVARVLVPGGRFGAWDPWKARLYELGTSVFGKRDPDVKCRPLDPSRVQTLDVTFPKFSEVRLHGALTRYPGVVWGRFVRAPSLATSFRVTRVDDVLSSKVRVLARNGSSCAVLATR